ncbi:MAG: bifunctional phosphoribosylaminoimidazolecarboxamide formyltransferase/IMP cyclohydrolase [Proteobacteria bacterium]|nr:bifunctional phosphoribosylaminoimidazolecarboxamide formyltransferase/IMP cyclohydrolase [Pseudomonadota bacterium]
MEMVKIKRALISATDKDLIKDFAIGLNHLGVEIYSTRGTASFLKTLGINAFLIENYTGFPEILDGRVKTLHPKIFGGILARRDMAEHGRQLKEHNITTFDLVCVDLYPVMKFISDGADLDNIIEHIDIGGISLIRASAKAFKDVAVLVDPLDFTPILEEMKNSGGISFETRKYLSGKAFQHSSKYDKAIFEYLTDNAQSLRYGENPHQSAKYFKDGSYIKEVIRGEISYNNVLDLDGAIELCFGLKSLGYKHSAVIVKHGSPCGVGVSDKNVTEAFISAWDCDPVSSYGGVLVLSCSPDLELLDNMKGKFVEVISAPSYSKDFIERSIDRKKLKVLVLDEAKILSKNKGLYRSACGGILSQNRDEWWNDFNGTGSGELPGSFKTVSKRKASKDEIETMRLAWAVCAITKSNAIIVAEPNKIIGIGGGCVSRIDATNMAVDKAKKVAGINKKCLVLASDGFLPFADSVRSAVELGVTAILEPGGSIRDQEVIDACDNAGLALVFTGKRHFRH